MSARRIIAALGISAIPLVFLGNKSTATPIVFEQVRVLMPDAAANVIIGNSPIEPNGLSSRDENLARQIKRISTNNIVSYVGGAIARSQSAFRKNMHCRPEIRNIRQDIGNQNLVLEKAGVFP